MTGDMAHSGASSLVLMSVVPVHRWLLLRKVWQGFLYSHIWPFFLLSASERNSCELLFAEGRFSFWGAII